MNPRDNQARTTVVRILLRGLAAWLLFLTATPGFAWELSESQQILLEQHGPPDSFEILFIDEGTEEEPRNVRLETWDYYASGQQRLFRDGELLAETPIEDVPEFSLLPRQYSPEYFDGGMALGQIVEEVLNGEEFAQIDAPEDAVAGMKIIGAEQLILGLIDDQLVYVQTQVIPLLPEKEGADAKPSTGGAAR